MGMSKKFRQNRYENIYIYAMEVAADFNLKLCWVKIKPFANIARFFGIFMHLLLTGTIIRGVGKC